MRLVTSIVLALCLVAFVSATCLSKVGDVFDANSGSTDVTLTETADLSDPSACKALLGDFTGQTQCCSADALTNLATIGDNIHSILAQAKTNFDSTISSIDIGANLDQETKDAIDKIPQLKKLYNDIVDAINTFKDRAPGHFGSCVDRIETYIAGALCSLCRPDFVPTILSIDNSTGTVVRTWKWAPATCTGLSNGCSPLWNDIDQLLLAFYDALITVVTDPQFSSLFNDTDFTTEFPHRDDIRPCVQMAREIEGSNTDVSQACRTAICYGLVHGLRNPSVFDNKDLGAITDFTNGLGSKRGSSGLSGIVSKFTGLSKSFRVVGQAVKRQSSNNDKMAYTGTVDATATGSENTIGTIGGSSAATLFVSAIAALIVLLVLLF